tara:strand:- start:621 stop:1967 length:1347 start_codon:yes stop_codon:yes gene_type:complete
MNLMTAATAVDGRVMGEDTVFKNVAVDSRQLQGGELFIALKGERFNGQDFISDAKRSGAVAVMTNRELEIDLPTLVVADTTKSLGQLAAYWREQFEVPLVAVTGSNGKTTVREMIARILQSEGSTLSAKANFNNHIGLPLTLLKLSDVHKFCVVEMGMNHAREISYLTKIAKPTVSVITNAASAHLEGLGDVTGVARAKAEIFLGMKPGGVAVINADDRFSSYWLARTRRYKTMTFGLDNQADVRGEVEFMEAGLDLEIQFPEDRCDVRLNLLGKHNARNALAAATVAWSLGVDCDRIKSGLQKVQPVNGRLQPRSAKNNANLIDDSYNANPASLRSAIRVLARKNGHRILVIGDMAELGSESERFHRAAGRYAREKGIQQLFTLGNLASFSTEEFGIGGTHFESFEELSEKLLNLLAPGIHILVKGSRSARMERVVDTLVQLEPEVG